jgi:diguanylate cyclase (GGDEF)-like protein
MSDKTASFTCPAEVQNCDVLSAIANLQRHTRDLEELIRTDALTGLLNFRGFEERLAQEMERTRRLDDPTCLIMIDIDHFKRVNDRHGHEIGNQALIHLAAQLQAALRQLDIPCRFGGEEFALILPSTRLAQAVQVAERIRSKIETTPLNIGHQRIPLTVSLGLAVFSPLDDLSVTELLKSADGYLYQAKHSGRNCICHPPIELSSEKGGVGSKERQDLFAIFSRKTT